MAQPKAALIEIDGSHDECLYSQLLFLRKGGYHTTLICNEKLRKQVGGFDVADDIIFFDPDDKSGWQELKVLWRIRQYIVQHNLETVILNTAHGGRIRNFTQLPFPKQFRFYGTMHGINKLKGSAAQKLISRKVKNYFLLNDYLVDNLVLYPKQKFRFQSYYPIFFPDYGAADIPVKEAGTTWIGIPGHIEFKRRDYTTLVEKLATIKEKLSLKFLLLGNGSHSHGNGKELKQLIAERGLDEYFVWWDGFMPNNIFHAYLKKCDVIMPLIHPINADLQKYIHDQISGSFNLAFAYHKPLLMYDFYKEYADFKENALFYDLGNMAEVIKRLPEELNKIQGKIYQSPKWTFDYQAGHYIDFLKHKNR